MLSHPQIKARGFVQEEDGQSIGFDSPFVFAHGPPRQVPQLGEHTNDVLKEFLTEKELIELTSLGIIGKRTID